MENKTRMIGKMISIRVMSIEGWLSTIKWI